ncbi:sensor histidine kinase [Phaeacidiphilus oryzae]|uniref:sensor histidine kinase n=1 Tax=Phaeacidiphilus oryzae TaxID=348818 RepID=UPI002AFF39B5|nr:GAF domain-containing protein [Phaeacidiphilus oryzae]
MELQDRLTMVRETRDRVHTLLEAVLGIGRDLELGEVLRHIVEAAVSLVDAEYGALGVIGEDGKRLAQFLTVGVSEAEIERIGPLPTGHGLLGELIRNPQPLRIPEIAQHPASYGFPANHPPMKTFLGVPIRVRDQVFGNLYLTDKHGGAEFDAEDEAVVSTLAVAAGIAVDNARLYAAARLRERWLRAGAEVTAALLSGRDEAEVLTMILERGRVITSADLAVVALRLPDGDELTVAGAQGVQADTHRGLVLPFEGSLSGAAIRARRAIISGDLMNDERITAGPPRFEGLGPGVAVPLGSRGAEEEDEPRGVLLLARRRGGAEFTAEEVEPLVGYAGQAALALELAERRREGEQITLLEERDRIARDLHDLAIQRIFASGMTLQGMARLVGNPGASERLQQVIDDLDETVRIIRTTIFGLRAHEATGRRPGLRTRAVQTVERMVPALGFTPALRLEGLLDSEVPAEIAEEALAALGEALTNIARHARASGAQVALTAGGEQLRLTVTDNGIGLGDQARRSGLRNLTDRAEHLGGRLDLTAGQNGEGTRLDWRVPLDGKG